MIEPQTVSIGDYIALYIGKFLGSSITIFICSFLLFYLYKLIRRKEAGIFITISVAWVLITIIDIFEGEFSFLTLAFRLLAGCFIGYIWEKTKRKNK